MLARPRPLPAVKQAAYRLRRRAGRASYRVEADEAALEDMLVETHWLASSDADDRAKVEAALERFVAAAIADHLAAGDR